MKALRVLLVVAIGSAVALWWTREPKVTPTQSKVTATQVPATEVQKRYGHPPTPALLQSQPTLEPTAPETEPVRRQNQDRLYQHLRKFARNVQLTDTQWERFQRDLSELAMIESAAWAAAVRSQNPDLTEVTALVDELGEELMGRCAAYMTEKQLAALRRDDPDMLVTQVRQLYYVPTMLD